MPRQVEARQLDAILVHQAYGRGERHVPHDGRDRGSRWNVAEVLLRQREAGLGIDVTGDRE